MLPICLQSELLFDPLAILRLIHSSYKLTLLLEA